MDVDGYIYIYICIYVVSIPEAILVPYPRRKRHPTELHTNHLVREGQMSRLMDGLLEGFRV